MESRRYRGLSIAAALAAGLALRAWFLYALSNVAGDSIVYGMFAKNLLEHGIYGFSVTVHGIAQVQPTLIRLPGYPLFLALCFALFGVERYMAVLIVQVLVDLCTCLLLAALAGRFFGPRAFLAALWMAALCPFMANYVAAPLTETLTLFTIALTFYALTRWQTRVQHGCRGINRWLFVIALALAYSIQLRPDQGLLAAAVVPAMFWIIWRPGKGSLRQALAPALLVSVLTLAPLVPWAVRNWEDFHIFEPLAPKEANDPGETVPLGFQRWYRTWGVDFASTEQVYWPYDGSPISIDDLPRRAFDSPEQYRHTAATIADYNENDTPTPAIDRAFASLAAQRIAAHRIRYYVALPTARLLNMLLRPRTDALPVPAEWWRFREHPGASLFALAYAALNLAYFLLAASVLRRGRYNRVIVLTMLAWVLLRCALLLTIDNSETRYTLEFFPVLIALGAGHWRSSSAAEDATHRPATNTV